MSTISSLNLVFPDSRNANLQIGIEYLIYCGTLEWMHFEVE